MTPVKTITELSHLVADAIEQLLLPAPGVS